MKNRTITTILLFALVMAGFVDSADAQERTKIFNVLKGGKVNVNVSPGEIIISTWDKDEVLVKVRGLEDEQLEYLEMSSSGNTVNIKYNSEMGWYDEGEFSITVPSRFNIEAKTSGGNIEIKGNIFGDVELSSMGGDLTTSNIKGKTRLSTQGGNVKIGDIEGGIVVNTMGGEITTGLLKGDIVKINTMGGDITIAKSNSGIDVSTYGGDIRIGDIGGDSKVVTYGGNINLGFVSGNVKMETYGGNLYLAGSKGKVKARTNGGNVNLSNVTGSVDATTYAGNITVELNPAPNSRSKISTNAGAVELKISPSAKATIAASIKVHGWWKDSKNNYKIYSEFESKSYEADDDRKEIRAQYELNGGGGLIQLQSVNSDIKIKKLGK